MTSGTDRSFPFDKPYKMQHTDERSEMSHALLGQVKKHLPLDSVTNLGCGPGLLSPTLSSLGLKYVSVDPRGENVQSALRR